MVEIDPEILLLEPREQFDEALVGYVNRFGQETIACYDYDLVMEALQTHQDMSYEEAVEWYHFNMIGAWAGERTPCFISSGSAPD
tara:strand:+ start:566 stop:820 length:255 start_codon:yes stop_codon:yes gene_type:complete